MSDRPISIGWACSTWKVFQLKNGKTTKQRLLNFGPFWDQKGQQDEIIVQLQLYACFFSSIFCASKVCRQLRIFKEFDLILNASKKV